MPSADTVARRRVSSSTGCGVTVTARIGDAIVSDHQNPIGAFGVRHELRRSDSDGQPTAPDATSASNLSRVSLGCNAFKAPAASTALPR